MGEARAPALTLRVTQLDLLVDASPSGTVAEGTVERLTQRWQERCSGEAAAAAAASNAVLAKFAAEAAAQRCVLRSGATGVDAACCVLRLRCS